MYIDVETDTGAMGGRSRVGLLSGLGRLFLLAVLEVPEPCLTLLGAGERAGGVRDAGYWAAAAAVVRLVANCRRVSTATAGCMVYSRGCCHAMSAVSAAMPCPWVPGATVLSVAAATRAARRRTLTVVAVVVAAVAVTAVSAAMPCPCLASRPPGTGVASVGHGVVLASTSDAAVIVSKLPVGTTESLAAGNVGRGLVPGAAVCRPLPVAAGATGETCACGAGAVFVIATQGRRRRNDRDAAAAGASDVVDLSFSFLFVGSVLAPGRE